MEHNFNNPADFVEAINALRRSVPGQWYQWVGTVGGQRVELKGFNTWLQIYRVDGIHQRGTLDATVKQFKMDLLEGVK